MSIIGRAVEDLLWIWTKTFGQGILYSIAMTAVTVLTTFKTIAQKVVKRKKKEEKEIKKTDP